MPPKRSGSNNLRIPKTPQASQTPWSTPPPSGAGSGTASSNSSIHPAPESAYDVINNQGGSKVETQDKDAPPSHKYPVSPPKSPTPKSPTALPSVITNYTSQTTAARNAAVAKDVEAVEELLGTMKLTLTALGSTFDTLGEQTLHVAALGPAIDANHQISLVRKQLEDQHKRQEARMVEVKAMLKEEVLDPRLQEKLREIASVVVKEIVRREIAERVRKELQEQIPQDMREQAARYKRQLMEVKASLHNSEARRYNALIRSSALDEPLQPLLRPFSKVMSPRKQESTPISAVPATPATGEASDPTTVPILEINELPNSATSAPSPIEIDLTPPTPSPLFPRDITGLMRLSPNEARTLVRDYGLEPLTIPETSFVESFETRKNEPQSSREEDLNRFMSYIGVGFHLVPGPNAPRPASPESPIASMVAK